MFARQLFMQVTVICAAAGLAQVIATRPLAGQEVVTSILAKSDSAAGTATPPAPPRASGLDLAISLRASTLGVGAEVSKLVMGHVGMRAGANFLNTIAHKRFRASTTPRSSTSRTTRRWWIYSHRTRVRSTSLAG